MNRQIYARIVIPAREIEIQALKDRLIEIRLKPLSEKHRRKARARIQGQRWGRIVRRELEAMVADMKLPMRPVP